MRWKMFAATALASVLSLAAAVPAAGQAEPAATRGGLPLVVGAGISDFNLDYGMGRREEGITIWADWNLYRLPGVFHGLGVEIEGRDININKPDSLTVMRQDTGQAGLIYTYRRYRKLHFYGKYLMGLGSIDFPPSGSYGHDTRTVSSLGGGAEYRLGHSFWLRGDYEYQRWPNLFGNGHALTPNGVTVGVVYNFMRAR